MYFLTLCIPPRANFGPRLYQGVIKGGKNNVLPNGKINSSKNFKFSLNFSKFLLKIVLKSLKYSIIFPKFVKLWKIFLKSQSLTLNTIYLNCYRLLQTFINFIKFLRNWFIIVYQKLNNILIFKQISIFNNFLKCLTCSQKMWRFFKVVVFIIIIQILFNFVKLS